MSTGVREFERLLQAASIAAICAWPAAVSGGPQADSGGQNGKPGAGGTPAVETAADQLSAAQARRLDLCRLALLNPSSDIAASDRESAVLELLHMNRVEAYELVTEGLVSGRLPVLTAITSVLLETDPPVQNLRDPVVAGLATAPPEAWTGLSKVAARYGTAGLAAVSHAAHDGSAAVSSRSGPIHALGGFRSRRAAEHLMTLLKPDRQEPAEIVHAACGGLDRLTGLSFGADPARWTRWWETTRELGDDDWLAVLIDGLSAKRSELEQQVGSVQTRLYQTYVKLFPSLTYERQLEELPVLLEDRLEVIRRFAIESLGRLARDRTIPVDLQHELAKRLDDEVAALRLAAASMLDQLAYAGLSDAVAGRIEREREPEVVRQYLDILAGEPSRRALPHLCVLIGEPALAEPAANALWSLAISDHAAVPDKAVGCPGLRAAYDQARTPELSNRLAGLLALLGDEGDVAMLIEALDDPDENRRISVAAGLAHRGRKDPLVVRAADEAIYPWAVLAIVSGDHTLARLQELIRLAPPASHRQAWADGVRTICRTLAAADVIVADDELQTIDTVDPSLRRDVLERAATAEPETFAVGERQEVLRRLVPLQLSLGQAQQAHTLLEGVPVADPDPLASLRLEAALRAERYTRAAEIHGDPLTWIAVLERLSAERVVDAARTLRDEIARRFADRLVDDVKTRFDAAAAGLSEPAPDDAVTNGPGNVRRAGAGGARP